MSAAVLFAFALPSVVVLPAAATQVIGACYDITVGDWAAVESTHIVSLPKPRPPDLAGDSVIYSLPPRVQFRDTPFGRPYGHVLAVPENSLQVPHSMMFWRWEADSLTLVVSTGFAGTSSRLTAAGEDWIGFAQTFSDVVGLLRYRRPIRLVRVDCAMPPPVPATADRPLLREIELASVGRLVLGDTLPAGVRTRPRRSSWLTVEASAAGPWAGADTIIARVESAGRVHQIELQYPEGHDLSAVVSALVLQFGTGRALGRSGTVIWGNRTTTLIVSHGEPRARVLLYDPRFR